MFLLIKHIYVVRQNSSDMTTNVPFGDFPSEQEWKNLSSHLFSTYTNFHGYKFVKSPSPPTPHPLPYIQEFQYDLISAWNQPPVGATVLTFDEVFANREAMNLLFSAAIEEYFPEDE